MTSPGQALLPLIKGATTELLGTEELVLDAIRDLVKDEVKRHILSTLDANPELKAELREAVHGFLEAKARELLAAAKLAKSGAKLGLAMLPASLKDEMTREVQKILEQELGRMFERTV